ncbi:MAG TPA: HAD-IC family P-type ATPase [Candidatus Faecaligallichristensenella faecipullorum]|nr:HAD-IC family P-type ATPase [Candidatus Faecaligallichristensenella faecipullorum]
MERNELLGLTEREVAERRQRGEGENGGKRITKRRSQIVKDNVLTLFNFLNFLIAGLLFAVGAYSNMLFIAIVILNIIIGIAQEFKAKKLVDELSILNRPHVKVKRNNLEKSVDLEEVVKDDLLILESGDQLCSDAIVVEGMLEVNESLLTGESDAVVKEKGAPLLSGSSVVAGRAYARVTHVGDENYATKLANEVKKEKRIQSELLGSMRKVTRFTSALIIPLGILMFLEAFFLRNAAVDEAVISSAAALLGMLPKGLVLLISVSLAAGVIRLAKMKILVQNIFSLETLAHVDTLCLDKTGTITDGNLKVHSIIPMALFPQGEIDRLVQSYMAACDDHNATIRALKEKFPARAAYESVHKIQFSSKRKWGCVSFAEGTVFVGAPERMLDMVPENLMQQMEKGRRVVVIGYTGGIWTDGGALPVGIRPLYAVILEDTIRPHARETLEFFRKEGVDVKVISGDHITTVSQIARRAGLHGWRNAIDMSALGETANYDLLCQKYSVFARVTPKQKQELVKSLKRQGHQVAMTGDGVNDLLALREADCSIAVADGSDASRQIAQVVLLDSDFTNLPQVVMEGRKVIHNVTRTAQVFFIKTIYSVLVSLFCLLTNQAFPFIPIQITLIDACIEAYPSFLTIFESDTRRIKERFLPTAIAHAAPFAIAMTIIIALTSFETALPAREQQTVMYAYLVLISMAAVVKSCIPFSPLRAGICVTMALGTLGALALFPSLFEVTALSGGMISRILIGTVLSLILVAVLDVLRRLLNIGQGNGRRRAA